MSDRLKNKAAIVTGGSRGIGAAIATRMAEDGADVLVAYRSDASAAEQVVERVRALGRKAHAIRADVTDPAEPRRIVDAALKRFGRIDVLVNNAGVVEGAPLPAITAEQFQRQFTANVAAVVFLIQAAAPALAETRGSVINLSSLNARAPAAGASLYSATKAAVSALTTALAQELGPSGVRVNAVAPGATETDMLNSVLPAEYKPMIAQRTALGRLGEPADIAAVVAFLASEEARWLSGETLYATGGFA